MTDKRSPLDEDFFIPTPASGTTIPVEEMSDLEYLKKSLFDALKIPKDNKKNEQ